MLRLACSALALCLCLAVVGSAGWACEVLVRDQAFLDPRDVHRLCVVSESESPQAKGAAARLRQWLGDKTAGPFNAALVEIDASDDKVDWPRYGLPSAPPILPVVFLSGYDRAAARPFVIDHWEPAPGEDDLAVLRTSPVREAIKREVGQRWAVLIFSPAANTNGESATSAVLQAIVKSWAEKHPPGISVVQFDRTDPRERLLVSFAALKPDGPDWVAVCFGRGKLLIPPLEGGQITEDALDGLLSQMIEICSCLRPPTMMGVDIPMTWETSLDESVAFLSPLDVEEKGRVAAMAPQVELPHHDRRLLTGALSALGLAALLAFGTTAFVLRRLRSTGNVSSQK